MPATALIMLAAVNCTSVEAAIPDEREHQPLEADPALTLAMVIDAALAVYPERPVLDARQEQAEAWNRRGRSLIQNRPSLVVRYQSDRWGSDVGLNEQEAGIALPLWSWGGRSAVRAFGDAIMSESEAARTALRWEVAGIVRQSLWNVALADNARQLAEQSLETAGHLVASIERRYQLGDLAQLDLLLAQSSYLEHETAVLQADAALVDAEHAYRTVTGLNRRPDFVAEALSETAEISAAHPLLALADIAVERAQANIEVARRTGNAGATVLIGTRRERAALGTGFDDSLGVTVSIPFGGGVHLDTATTAAARTAANTKAVRAREFRMLTLEMHERVHSLGVIQESYATALERLEIAERHQAMGESAYEGGEIELLDLLKIKETAIVARRLKTQLEIDKKRQTALYNQAIGELP